MIKMFSFLRKKSGSIKENWERLSQRTRRALLLIQLISLSIYAIYLIYEITKGSFVELKLILLVATIGYAVVYVILHDKIDKPSKARRKSGKRLYSITKILVKGCTLAITFYGIFSATVETTFWSVTLAVLMLIGWMFSLLFEILCRLIDKRIRRFTNTASTALGQIKSIATGLWSKPSTPTE